MILQNVEMILHNAINECHISYIKMDLKLSYTCTLIQPQYSFNVKERVLSGP